MQVSLTSNIDFGSKKQFKRMFPVCAYSGEPFEQRDTRTIEHIIPRIRGGSEDLANKIVVKRSWNSLRSDMPLGQFIEKFPQVQEHIVRAVKALEGHIIDGINWAEEVKKTLLKEIGRNIFE